MVEEPTSPESAEQALSDAVADAIDDVVEVDPIAVLTGDLQRLQADFANYRKRIDKERSESADVVTGLVLAQLLGALDNIDRAEEHGELTGGFKAVADQLVATITKLGLAKFVDVGVAFDPNIHEALMHETSPEVSDTQVTKVLRPGYTFKERVLRPAQVIVTDPEA
jgi:molecular chaperone GrpE